MEQRRARKMHTKKRLHSIYICEYVYADMKQKPSKVTANEYQGEPRGRKIIPRTGLFCRLSLIFFLASENIKQNSWQIH